MTTKALFDIGANTLAEVEAETLGNTLADVKVEAPLYALADTVAEVEAHTLLEMEPEKFGDTVADVEGIAYTIRQLKVDTLVGTLGDVWFRIRRLVKHWGTWRLRHWSQCFLTRYQRWWPRQSVETTCVEAEAPVKTEGDTVARVEA